MNSRVWTIVLFVILGALYFGSMDRLSLTDPDETFYSMTAAEMNEHGSLVTPLIFGQPQFEKPPLFYWLLMVSFKLLGVGPFAARLIPALCGFLGVAATFLFCRRIFNDEIAWIASILLGTSSLYLAMSKAVLTDITLSVLMMAAFYAFYLWVHTHSERALYAFGAAAALAVLTKGPVAIIILFLTAVIFLAVEKDWKRMKVFLFHPWILVFAVISVPWYAAIIAKHGQAFINEFIIHDNIDRIKYAEHASFDRWWFYPAVMTAGSFPWTFYLMMMGRWWKEYRRECVFFLIWFAVTFVVFQRAHSKLASYILPLMPAIILPLSISISSLASRNRRSVVIGILYFLLGIGFMAAPAFIPPQYADFVTPAAVIGIRVFGASLMAGALLLWQGRMLPAIIVQSAGITIMFLLVGMCIPGTIDRVVSGHYIQKIAAEQKMEGEVIVTNKLYSRGIHFYTGSPVVVWDHKDQPFWSPHPIKIISNYNEIKHFFDQHDRVLCVIKNSYANELDNMFKDQRVNRRLSDDTGKIVLISEKIK